MGSVCAVICTPGRQIATFSTNNYAIHIAQSFLLTGVALRLCEHEGRVKDFKFVVCTTLPPINRRKVKHVPSVQWSEMKILDFNTNT